MGKLQTVEKEKLRKQILDFSKSINRDNFSKKYNPLIELIMPYKSVINEKKDIADLLSDIIKEEELDENQEEVLGEVECIFYD